MRTHLRKKTINGREYFHGITPYWDSEKKVRYHSRYRGVQKENGIEKIRTHLPGTFSFTVPSFPS